MFFNFGLKRKKKKWFKSYKKSLYDDMPYLNEDLKEVYSLDSNVDIYCISLYDSINNDEANKLIKKLHKLKKNNKYEIDTPYRKKEFKNINYIHTEFDGTGHGILAKIKFKDDDLISYIDMTWTQVNNEEAVIEYEFHFKKIIKNFSEIHKCVLKQYKRIKKAKYSQFYLNNDFLKDDIGQRINCEFDYFETILQNYLESISCSHYLRSYKLPLKTTYLIDKKTKKVMKYIKEAFLSESYIVDDQHYLMLYNLYDIQGSKIDEFIIKKRFNPFSITRLLSEHGMKMYYILFYKIEKNELDKRITKFLNSKKIFLNLFDYKWLINKQRKINEKKFYDGKPPYIKELKGYSDSKIVLPDDKTIDGIKKVYDDNIDFIKNMNTLNYNVIAFIVSFLAFIVAMITLIIEIWSK